MDIGQEDSARRAELAELIERGEARGFVGDMRRDALLQVTPLSFRDETIFLDSIGNRFVRADLAAVPGNGTHCTLAEASAPLIGAGIGVVVTAEPHSQGRHHALVTPGHLDSIRRFGTMSGDASGDAGPVSDDDVDLLRAMDASPVTAWTQSVVLAPMPAGFIPCDVARAMDEKLAALGWTDAERTVAVVEGAAFGSAKVLVLGRPIEALGGDEGISAAIGAAGWHLPANQIVTAVPRATLDEWAASGLPHILSLDEIACGS